MNLSIREYESVFRKSSITNGSESADSKFLDDHLFDSLEQFILDNRQSSEFDSSDSNPLELLSIGSRNGIKAITARNYVGVIEFQDGRTLEILPKIWNHEGNVTDEEIRELLVDMLESALDIKEKRIGSTNLHTTERNILEIFIAMFHEEVNRLVHDGLRCAYSDYAGNEGFFRGRVNFNENIRWNLVHKERIFVEYQVYDVNRPENRLIKTTLKKLSGRCRDIKNQRLNRMLLSHFDEVEDSFDPTTDFSLCVDDKNMCGYERILQWCRLFLNDQGLHVYSGSNVAYAFLFPMEDLFELFVADKLLDHLPASIRMSLQELKKKLFGRNLKPDIVLRSTNSILVLDTKWKILSKSKGAKVEDLYQMFVYSKKYESNNIILIYPLDPKYIDENGKIEYRDDDIRVHIKQIDLLDMRKSTESLVKDMLPLLVTETDEDF